MRCRGEEGREREGVVVLKEERGKRKSGDVEGAMRKKW
jgi:hypothetical protein